MKALVLAFAATLILVACTKKEAPAPAPEMAAPESAAPVLEQVPATGDTATGAAPAQ